MQGGDVSPVPPLAVPSPRAPSPWAGRAGGLPSLRGWHEQRGSFIHHLPPQLSARNSAMTWPWAERQRGTLPTGCWWHPVGSKQPGVGWLCIQGLPLRVIFRPCCAAFLSPNLACSKAKQKQLWLPLHRNPCSVTPRILGEVRQEGGLGAIPPAPTGPR